MDINLDRINENEKPHAGKEKIDHNFDIIEGALRTPCTKCVVMNGYRVLADGGGNLYTEPTEPKYLKITFDDIVNCPVTPAGSVSAWNTFFGLPDLSVADKVFSKVTISGNTVGLYGPSWFILDDQFKENTNLISFIDDPFITETLVGALYGCTSLSGISLPITTIIREASFFGCSSLSNIDLLKAITIGNAAFNRCISLSSVTLPMAETIDIGAFFNCTSLSGVNFPLVSEVKHNAFQNCFSLTRVTLPIVSTIGNNTFQSCISLEEIYIPSCTTLGSTVGDNSIFLGITGNLINLTVDPTLMTCNDGQPDGDIQYLGTNNNLTVNGVPYVPPATELELTYISGIPYDTLLDWNIFLNGNFTSLETVGNIVKLYGGSNISLPEGIYGGNESIQSIDDKANCIVSVGISTFEEAISLNYVNLPASTSLGQNAFLGCLLLTGATFNSLISIGVESFGECTGLITLNLPLVQTIDDYGFYNTTALRFIDLSSCINLGSTIGLNDVFNGCIGHYNPNGMTLKVPSALMTCNDGQPDGDIAYLQANNNITITQV